MVFLTLYKTWKVRYTMSCCWLPHSRWFSCNMVLIGGQYLHFQTWLKILVLACWMLKLSFADALKSYMLVYPHEHLTKSLYIPMICPLHPLFLARPIWFPSSPDFFPSKSPSNPITRRVTWKNPMKSLTSNKIQLRFAWNSHEIVISFLLSPTGGLQKIQEVKAEVHVQKKPKHCLCFACIPGNRVGLRVCFFFVELACCNSYCALMIWLANQMNMPPCWQFHTANFLLVVWCLKLLYCKTNKHLLDALDEDV